MNLIITGAPGAGKGTIAQIIEEDLKLFHISTGDMLRDHIHKGDEIGKRVKAIIDSGNLISDKIIEEIVHERLEHKDIKKVGALIDGFPRTIHQAKDLLNKAKIDGIIEVFLEDNIIINRLSKRLICPNCGASYHLETKKPKIEGVCDVCSSKLIHREDDKPEIVKERLETYHKETAPIVDLFKDKEISYLQLRGDLDIKTQRDFIIAQVKKLRN